MTTPDAEGTRADPASLAEVEALAERGKAAAPELVRLLDHPSWSVRRTVIASLATLGDEAVGLLCESLRSERASETRIAATVDTLVASLGDVDGAVMELHSDSDPHVAADVAQILGRRRSVRGVPTLIALTAHADDNVAVGAIEALGRIGSRAAVDAVLGCLESGNFFRAFPAIDVLGRTADPRVVAPLARLLRDPRYAFEAARALGRTGDRQAVAPLAEMLTWPQNGAVRVACLALRELRSRHVELYGISAAFEEAMRAAGSDAVVRRLDQSATDASVAEKVALCAILGALHNQAGVPVLQRFLAGSPEVTQAAALALRQLGRAADEPEFLSALRRADSAGRRVLLPLVSRSGAAAAVSECLSDTDATVRALACETLARIGNTSATPALFELFADPNARVVHAAIGAVQSLGSEETSRLALAAARSASASVRRAAMRVLGYFGHEVAFQVLREALFDDDDRVREAAIHGLGCIEGAPARDCLLSVAQSPHAPSRAAAMRALACTAAPDTITSEALLNGTNDDDAWVRYYAAQSLGKLRLEVGAMALIRLLDDPAAQVRLAAVEALSHLPGSRGSGALAVAAQSADLDTQRAALLGLSMARHLPALPLLLGACKSGDAATRLVALSAAASFEAPEVLDALATAARDADDNVRIAALGFLSRRPEPQATDILVDVLATVDSPPAAVAALSTPAPARVSRLAHALAHADGELAPRLASCLARLGTEEATSVLMHALELGNGAARRAAIATLLATGNRDALAAITRLAAQDPDADVRRMSALYLAQ